jgi:ABC-type glycerol-3-phosphate transport system substrate-binding protein
MSRVCIIRVLAIVMLATLVVSACAAPATPTPPAEKKEPVTLTYWTAGPAEPLKSATEGLVAAFMQKYPWITVKVEAFPYAEYFQKVDTATAGKQAPDVLWVDNQVIPRYVYHKMIIPLDQFVGPNYANDWFPTPKDEMYFKGNLWAIPLHQSTEAILYNKAIIDAAGLKPPTSYDKAWNFEEFRAALKAVTKKTPDGKTEVWGFAAHYTPVSVYSLQPLMFAYNGATLIAPDKSSYTGYTDSDASVEALKWYAQLYKDGLAPIEKTPDMFQTGKVAFYQTNPFVLVDIQKRYPDLKVGVMPMPCGKNCAVQSGAYHIGIHAQTKHPKEAWMLVDFITNFDGHKQWIESTGYMPARLSVYEALPKLKEYPWAIFMEGLAKHAVRRPITEAWTLYDEQFQAAVKNVILGADPKAELQRVARMADEELKKYK